MSTLGEDSDDQNVIRMWRGVIRTAHTDEYVDYAVYYPEDDRFLVERDDTVRHYVQRG